MPTVTPPTLDEQIMRGLAYMFTAAVGGSVLTTSIYGTLIERQLGYVAIIWAVFMLTGIPAAIATILGQYRYEYAMLPCFTSALLVANLLAWSAIIAGGDDTAIPRACVSSALVLMLSWRWRSLHRLIRVLQWTKPLHRL